MAFFGTSSGTHVLVLAKAPDPGRVKTRLCPPYTPAEAAAIAEASLADTLEAVAACGADRRILALDGMAGPWLPAGLEVVPQVPGSLNERLAAAWEFAGGPGLQIGMDTPQVTADLLDSCLATVVGDHTSAALGPAEDGGWWAIGLGAPHRDAFRGVPMSRSYTGRRQLARLRSLGLVVERLPRLRDIDTADDARAIAAAAPHTRTAGLVSTLSRVPA